MWKVLVLRTHLITWLQGSCAPLRELETNQTSSELNELDPTTSRYLQPSGSSGCSRWDQSQQHQDVTQKKSVSHHSVQLHGGRPVKEPLLQRRARFLHGLQVLKERGHGHPLAILHSHRCEDLCHLLRSVVDVEVSQASPHLRPADDAVAVVEEPHRGLHRALLRRQQARHLQAREALADLPSRLALAARGRMARKVAAEQARHLQPREASADRRSRLALLHLHLHDLLRLHARDLLVRRQRELQALRELPVVGIAELRRERPEDAQPRGALLLHAEQVGHQAVLENRGDVVDQALEEERAQPGRLGDAREVALHAPDVVQHGQHGQKGQRNSRGRVRPRDEEASPRHCHKQDSVEHVVHDVVPRGAFESKV
mmetsp:Transcript_37903/g.106503  ORF Transcript_37903/g.106503 Transcript_37903/m.106503 type:complete len:372 (+) Transcript_37903:240-1355(+)